jgi:hypothetical protein
MSNTSKHRIHIALSVHDSESHMQRAASNEISEKNWWKINLSKASQKKGDFAPLAPLRTLWFLNVLPCTVERNYSHVDRLKFLPNDPRAQRLRWVATGRLSTPRISGLWSKPLLTKARVAYLFWCLVYLFSRHRAASSERGLYRTYRLVNQSTLADWSDRQTGHKTESGREANKANNQTKRTTTQRSTASGLGPLGAVLADGIFPAIWRARTSSYNLEKLTPNKVC